MDVKTPYDVLGVAVGSEDVVIQAAYRALMQKYHPDKAGDDPAAMKRAQAINDAYAVLNSRQRRADLDRRLAEAKRKPVRETSKPTPAAAAAPRKWSTAQALVGLGALLFLGFIAFGLMPSGGDAAPAAPLTVEAPDAPTLPMDTLAANAVHEWSADQETSQAMVIGGLGITLYAQVTAEGAVPVIRVVDEKGAVYEARGVVGFDVARATFGVGKLDAASDASQILFQTFSGGAHCCTSVVILDRVDGRWRSVDVGDWDGEGLRTFPRDLGGDEDVELQFVDNAFLYAFASYAESYAPSLILKLRNGQIEDASDSSAYRRVHIADMAESETGCREGNNGACAAYVASAARAGRLNDAWAFMLAHYNRASDWMLPTGCRADTDGACPDSLLVTFETFPEALQYFLGVRGYMAPAYVPSAVSNGRPSFDCTRVTSAVLSLVCTTPLLGDADRELAIAYTRAMAFSQDRAALQRDQQDFVRARNNLVPDVESISQAYARRIGELRAIAARMG